MKFFDGTSKEIGNIPRIPKTKYRIEITLHDKDDREEFDYGDHYPPMPADIGGWVIIKKASDIYFLFNPELKKGAHIQFDTSQVNTIVIDCTKKPQRTRFYLNDNLVSVKKFYIRLKSHYRLGVGFKERFWKGNIEKVAIYGDTTEDQWASILLI